MGKHEGHNYKNDSMLIWLTVANLYQTVFRAILVFFLYRASIFYTKFIFVSTIKPFYPLDLCFCFNGQFWLQTDRLTL